VDEFVMHQGFGSSPVVHGSVVLVTADHRGGGAVAALDARTGEIKWQHERPKIANYASPAVIKAGGKTQVVVAGCNLISSYDPASGKKLWEIEGSTEETVVTAVTDGSRIFVGGGYPKNHTVAIEADGSGRIAWQNGNRQYVPSMLVRDGHLYAVLDAGQGRVHEVRHRRGALAREDRPRLLRLAGDGRKPDLHHQHGRRHLRLRGHAPGRQAARAKPTRRRVLLHPFDLRQPDLPAQREEGRAPAGVPVVHRRVS
jgi:hypothetical protein